MPAQAFRQVVPEASPSPLRPEIRVLLVTPRGDTSGSGNLMLAHAIHLPNQGIIPTLLSLRPGPLVERATRAGVVAHAFEPSRRSLTPLTESTRWIIDWAQRTRSHLIHATHSAFLQSALASRSTRLPALWHLLDHPASRDLLGVVLRRFPVSHTIFATRAIVRSYPRQARGPHSIIHPTCVDLHALHATEEDPRVRERHQLQGGPLFLTVARLNPAKGHRYLVDAAALVLREVPDAVFAVAGAPGSPSEHRYAEALVDYARALGVAGRLHFLGFVTDRDLVNLYRAATAVVHPVVGGGYSITLQEALSLGVPVIAAEADGPRELIENERTGLLVPTRSGDTLAHAMLRILRDRALARRLGEAARVAARMETLQTMIARTAQTYREVLQRAPRFPLAKEPRTP